MKISDTEESNDVITSVILTSYFKTIILFISMTKKLHGAGSNVPMANSRLSPLLSFAGCTCSLSLYGKIVGFLRILFNARVLSPTFRASHIAIPVFLLGLFSSEGEPICLCLRLWPFHKKIFQHIKNNLCDIWLGWILSALIYQRAGYLAPSLNSTV